MTFARGLLCRWVGVVAVALSASFAQAAPYITTDGFESPDFESKWNPTGLAGTVQSPVFAGTWAAKLEVADPRGESSISKVLSALDSGFYDISFAINTSSLSGAAWSVAFGGKSVVATDFGTGDIADRGNGWFEYFWDFGEFAGGTSSLTFLLDGIGIAYIDSVEVACTDNCVAVSQQPVPEPGTLALIGVALAAATFVRKRNL